MTWIILAGLALGYEVLVRVQMRRSVAARYNAVFARVLRAVTSDNVKAISLWRTCWMKYPPTSNRGRLSPKGKLHEFQGHILNPNQWAGHPRSAPFRYLVLLAWYGYEKHPWEIEADRIAAEAE